MTPAGLLLSTFLAGTGAALSGPVWLSIVPELVERPALKSAVALNSIGINIARAIGPALGGALIVGIGVAAAFLADALTYVLVLTALVWWKRQPTVAALPPEHLFPAMLAALRYARSSAPLKRTLFRAFLFFAFGSAPWALLPLLVREDLSGGAGFYGVMLGLIGAGAICGALVMPRLRRRLSTDRLVLVATILLSIVGLGLAATDIKPVALALMPLLGLAWISVLTSLNVITQSLLPDWVRGRGLALYLTMFFGATASGSLVWGQVAQLSSTQAALAVSAALGLVAALLATRLPLPAGDEDVTPSMHWPEPAVGESVKSDSGPVMVMIEYRVAAARVAGFKPAIEALGVTRRRDGAFAWGVFQDTENLERFVEYFLVESWVQHLRQHRRVSRADQALQAVVRSFHIGADAPKISHLIAVGQLPIPAEILSHHHEGKDI